MNVRRLWWGSVFASALVLGAVVPAIAHVVQTSAMPVAGQSLHRYTVPAVTLVDQHDHAIDLPDALAGKQPVLVQFFFSSCTTICDVRSAQIVSIAPKLKTAGIGIKFYSISIDPDHDTPQHLLAYSRHFGVQPPPNWYLLTGSVAQIHLVQAAFNASDPSDDRMMHKPLTFIRAGAGRPWVRIDELMSEHELEQEIKATLASARH